MPLERTYRSFETVGRLAALAGGYVLLGLSLLICAEILLRRFIGISLQGVDEIGGYVLAGVSAFGFGYALLARAHTRIDILFYRLGPRVQAALNLLSAAAVAAVACFMLWRAAATFQRSAELGSAAATPLQTPIWIPQLAWVLGLGFFAAVAVMLLVRALLTLRAQGSAGVNAMIGPLSLEAGIEEETDSVDKT